ncbi:MAG: hypothetical protein M3O34_07525 [Chloroflexota bacterium]|nr:hypothetical protein [Chloroflexota bacterium]
MLAPAALISIVLLVLGALIVLLFTNRLTRDTPLLITLGVVSLVVGGLPAFGALRADDAHTALAIAGVAAAGAIGMLLVGSAELQDSTQRPEIAALILLGSAGGVAFATAGELLSAVLGLETLSLTAAIMVALSRGERPLEAAFKYFVLAAISFATLVYGVGLVFMATGSFAFPSLAVAEPAFRWLLVAGVLLVGLGFAYELALVPLHWGLLDSYTTGAPALVGFVLAASKIAAVVALSRLLGGLGIEVPLASALIVIGLISIVWGTLGALAQRELRRLLAYSTVANAGFLALALGCGASGRAAAIFFVVVYALTSLLVFATLSGRGTGPLPLADVRAEGFGPLRAIALSIGLLSLAGIPPAPGFWSKLAVLQASWEALGWLPTLIAALGGVAGVLYYLRPLPDLFAVIRTGAPGRLVPSPTPAVLLAGAGVVLLAIAPGVLYALARFATGA